MHLLHLYFCFSLLQLVIKEQLHPNKNQHLTSLLYLKKDLLVVRLDLLLNYIILMQIMFHMFQLPSTKPSKFSKMIPFSMQTNIYWSLLALVSSSFSFFLVTFSFLASRANNLNVTNKKLARVVILNLNGFPKNIPKRNHLR